MARINLLPWRDERRKQRQKHFTMMLVLSAVAGVVLSFLIISYYNGQIDGEKARIAYLNDQIAQVDKQIAKIEELDAKKSKLLARKAVIEQLQANRSQMVHLFDSLVRTIPDGVVLTAIKQDGKTLTLDGRAQSNARVSTYMRNLQGSGWMANPELSIIEARDGGQGLPYGFTLSVKLANPNAPTDLDGDGIVDPVPAEPEAIDATAAGTDAATPTPPTTVEAEADPTEPAAPSPAQPPADPAKAAEPGTPTETGAAS